MQEKIHYLFAKIFISVWVLASGVPIQGHTNSTYHQQLTRLDTIISNRIVQAKEPFFVILVGSRNNESLVPWNLGSIFSQIYPTQNFHVVYIDDASTDQTKAKVQKWVMNNRCENYITIISNETHKGKAYNFFHIIRSLPNKTIVVELDGDDAFAHPFVLAEHAKIYKDSDIWVTYSKMVKLPEQASPVGGYPEYIVKKNQFRQFSWRASALRTFRADLFKKIRRCDLEMNGTFFDVCFDFAMIIPMLEMAGSHSKYLDDICYLYNLRGQNHDVIQKRDAQSTVQKYLRSLAPYEPLESL